MRTLSAVCLCLLLCCLSVAGFAATPAGTLIRNQASASFTDASGQRHTVTSNIVETLIEQVAGVSLDPDQQRQALSGTTVVFPHRVINTGNGDDRYALGIVQETGDNGDFVSVAIHADVDQDGVADTAQPIVASPWLLAGESFAFVVVAELSPAQTVDDTLAVRIEATSGFDTAVVQGNLDTVRIVDGAVLSVEKSIVPPAGAASGNPYVVTLTLGNAGQADAGALTLIDALPLGMAYVTGSARIVGQGTVLSDGDSTDVQTVGPWQLRYCAYDTSCVGLPESTLDADSDSRNQLTLLLDTLPAGDTLRLTFDVTLDSDAAAVLTNRAELDTGDPSAWMFSNPVDVRVAANRGVVLNGSNATSIDGMNEPLIVPSAPQGGDVQFPFTVWNTGNANDTINLEVLPVGSSFPFGSVYRLLAADGATPLLDTTADGVIDTGPLAAGTSRTVVLHIQLPAGSAGNNGGPGFGVEVSGRSAAAPVVQNSVLARLSTISGNRVDVTNQAPAGDASALGIGAGPEPLPVSTLTLDQGRAIFTLFVQHDGDLPDSYRLTAAGDPAGGALPAGWAVAFSDGNGNDGLTRTESLAAGEAQRIIATVSVPPGQASGTYSVYFLAESELSGARDLKHDAVQVPSSQRLRFEPSLSAQLEAGGTVVYQHLLVNAGNSPIDTIDFSVSHSLPGWQSVLYADTDLDGRLGPDDQAISSMPALLPGESRDLFLKVYAPATASLGQRDIASVTANWTTASGSESLTLSDTSQVSNTHVSISKLQAVDQGCDGTPDADSRFDAQEISVAPGNNCVIYRLIARNRGTETSYNVVIHDYTPPFTVYRPSALCSLSVCRITEPQLEDTGVVIAETDQLAPGESYYLQFSVRVQ